MTSTSLPAVAPPSSLLRNWITGCLLGVLAFGVCWTGAIVYWRAQEGDPGTGELMFYMFILPAALLTVALLARKHLGDASAAAAARPDQAPVAPPPALPPATFPLAIIAAAVRSPHGATVEALATTLEDKKAAPTLDASLVDDAGYPLATARCDDAADADVLASFATWRDASGIDVAFDDAGNRALVMATHIATELAEPAARLLADAALLHLAPVLPSGWTRAQRQAAGLWLQHTVAQGGWPADRIDILPAVDTDRFDAVPALLLADLAQRPVVTAMVIACASHLGEDTILRWRASQLPGAAAGEGAAGLLLTAPDHAAAVDRALFAVMEPVRAGRRDTDADTSRGPLPPLLATLAEAALAAAQCAPNALKMIVADTSARPGRMLELMGYAGAATPQLDDQEDIVAFGHASGSCSAVPALTALALARHHACARIGPVLWISNDDAFQRCVAVVHPPRAP